MGRHSPQSRPAELQGSMPPWRHPSHPTVPSVHPPSSGCLLSYLASSRPCCHVLEQDQYLRRGRRHWPRLVPGRLAGAASRPHLRLLSHLNHLSATSQLPIVHDTDPFTTPVRLVLRLHDFARPFPRKRCRAFSGAKVDGVTTSNVTL